MSMTMQAFQPHPTLFAKYSTLRIFYVPSHVVVVELYHPRKHNAISATMWKEIGHLFSSQLGRLGDDDRVVILKGHGNQAFSAGIDMSDESLFPSWPQQSDDHTDPARRGLVFGSQIRDMQDCFTAIEQCPVPVIAAIEGNCIGAGVDLCCACDIRLCAENAQFSIREVHIGLAADIGTLQRMPKITANDSRVRELCFTGDFFDAKEALRIGLVSRISNNVMEDAFHVAQKIAANSPLAVLGTKRSLVYSRDHTVAQGLEHIATHNTLALMTDDIPAAVVAAKRKTKATFEPIPKFSRL
jgi:Delta3,5-Delta2,4-dienoyl-CoA isomerase